MKITSLLVALTLFCAVAPSSAQAPVRTVELTYFGHLCVEMCELGVSKFVKDKDVGWVSARYVLNPSKDAKGRDGIGFGSVVVTVGPRSKVNIARIVRLSRELVFAADLTQITLRGEKGEVLSVTKVPRR